MSKPKNTHGGRRKGAGRIPSETPKSSIVQFRIDPKSRREIEEAAEAAEVSASKFYRIAAAFWSDLIRGENSETHVERFKHLIKKHRDK